MLPRGRPRSYRRLLGLAALPFGGPRGHGLRQRRRAGRLGRSACSPGGGLRRQAPGRLQFRQPASIISTGPLLARRRGRRLSPAARGRGPGRRPPAATSWFRGGEGRDGVDIDHGGGFPVPIGRGVSGSSKVAEFERLAESLGAVRQRFAPVDRRGWIARSRGVGQSGNDRDPERLPAFGISRRRAAPAGIAGRGDDRRREHRSPRRPSSRSPTTAVADCFRGFSAWEAVGCER